MFEISFEDFKPYLLVSLGAISGTCLRFSLSNYIQSRVSKKYLATILVNTLASFFFGLLIASQSKHSYADKTTSLALFAGVGFLGSFSTFSAFILDAFKILHNQRWLDLGAFVFISVSGGLFFTLVGYLIGNVS